MSNQQNAATDNPVIRFFINRMPSHLKRMVFIASLTGVVNDTVEPDAEFIKKLNKIMNLSESGDNALKLPIFVSKLIWKHTEYIQKDLDVLVSPDTGKLLKQECIGRIAYYIPTWLKYADSDTVTQDLCKLFQPTNGLIKSHQVVN
jgi:hypothetical protein